MYAEYDELLKITDKLKSELDYTNGQIKLKSEIIVLKDILETQEKDLVDNIVIVLEAFIREGVRDKYIHIAYEQIIAVKIRLHFDEIMKMPEKGRNQILTKLNAFLEFQKKYPGISSDEVNLKLIRLKTIPEIIGIFEMAAETVNELSKKVELLKKNDRSKKSADEWCRRYKKFSVFSSSLNILFNLCLWVLISVHYFNKGGNEIGNLNNLGCFVGGILQLFAIIMVFGSTEIDHYIRGEEKKKIIKHEFGKLGLTSSLPITCYINMVRNPETFFNWNLLLAILLAFISLILILDID
jgi:hypothetical protein